MTQVLKKKMPKTYEELFERFHSEQYDDLDDWIIDPAIQVILCTMIDNLIAHLDTML